MLGKDSKSCLTREARCILINEELINNFEIHIKIISESFISVVITLVIDYIYNWTLGCCQYIKVRVLSHIHQILLSCAIYKSCASLISQGVF